VVHKRPIVFSLFVMFVLGLVLSFSSTALAIDMTQPSGSGTSADPYRISNLAELSWLSQQPSEWEEHYVQVSDIDASQTRHWDDSDDNGDGDLYNDTNDTDSNGNNEGFSPIGGLNEESQFTGSFDGQGHVIKNLYINRKNEYQVSLIGATGPGAEISNLGMVNVDVVGGTDVGGLIGGNYGGTVLNSYATGSVSGLDEYSDNVGGLLGGNDSEGSVSNSYATASVSGDADYVGGLVGTNNGLVSNSYATGKVSGDYSVGGLVGDENGGKVNNSFWNTETSGQDDSAGGTGLTTSEMQDISIFDDAGWDIEAVPSNQNKYPHLAWETRSIGMWLQEQDPYLSPDPTPSDGATNVSTSPTLEVDVSDPDGNSIDVTFYDASDDSEIGTDTNVSDGGTASVDWTGRDNGTAYDWYAVADDGNDTTESATWSFTTNYVPDADANGPYSANVGETITLDGSGSSDPDGSIDEYDWDLDDDGSYDDATGEKPSHSWSSSGTHAIGLRVTDSDGAAATDSTEVDVNASPNASFSYSASDPTIGESITFDASDSSDTDGSIDEYDWDFDDGNTGSGESVDHSYDDDGTYSVALTVTDNDGATDTATKEVEVSNVGPEASFTYTPSEPSTEDNITFNASDSSDPDGSIDEYKWDFDGDGTFDKTTSSPTTSHSYSQGGAYTVELKVIDDGGLTDSTTEEIEIGSVSPEALINHGPNPVPPEGCIFWLDLPDDASEATLKVYDVDGRPLDEANISSAQGRYPTTGRWQPRDANGHKLGSGYYMYRLKVDHTDGSITWSDIQKMVVERSQ